MNTDAAVPGGGAGGYTAALRAAQPGANVARIEREHELGGTCLRIGCIPTKSRARAAPALKQASRRRQDPRQGPPPARSPAFGW
jgi:dihydrolipoamide dehydrogenase